MSCFPVLPWSCAVPLESVGVFLAATPVTGQYKGDIRQLKEHKGCRDDTLVHPSEKNEGHRPQLGFFVIILKANV